VLRRAIGVDEKGNHRDDGKYDASDHGGALRLPKIRELGKVEEFHLESPTMMLAPQ